MTFSLEWTHGTAELGELGRSETRHASADELTALASALEILSCERLYARYEIAALGQGRFRLSGELEADVTQACVVTLDPVPGHIHEHFAVEFWPKQEPPSDAAGERAILTGADVEPIEGGRIDAGRIVFEHLSAALDPYPRKPGAEFRWDEAQGEAGAPAESPFSVLAKLKEKK